MNSAQNDQKMTSSEAVPQPGRTSGSGTGTQPEGSRFLGTGGTVGEDKPLLEGSGSAPSMTSSAASMITKGSDISDKPSSVSYQPTKIDPNAEEGKSCSFISNDPRYYD